MRLPTLVPWLALAGPVSAQHSIRLPGLTGVVEVERDHHGVPHLRGGHRRDVWMVQGYIHAQDRLFQMDVLRRQASGTLAELFGAPALASDVQLRTVGVRRAAERSLAALSPLAREALQAFAAGVNAWVARNPMPFEYGALELTRVQPWTELDSVAIGRLLTLQLSFGLTEVDGTITLLTYQAAGQGLGFDGTRLFFEDLFRVEPFDHTTTLAGPGTDPGMTLAPPARVRALPGAGMDPTVLPAARRWLQKVRSAPLLARLLEPHHRAGSNQWVLGGQHTATGRPLLANDPHLALMAPSIWHPIHLQAGAEDLDVAGASLPGSPGVVVGHNQHLAWGLTTNHLDMVDIFREEIVRDPASPSGLAIVHRGQREAILPIPETYRQNNLGDTIPDNLTVVPPGGPIPPATLIVPRRNQGPIVDLDLENLRALSVQWVGFAATRDLDGILGWNGARNLAEFEAATLWLDAASLNLVYADRQGHIAYLMTGENPLREDLQAGAIQGALPSFIRDGRGGNEWLPLRNRQHGQTLEYEILPAAEMPRSVDPESGWLANANNDPVGVVLDNDPYNRLRPGGGILYLGSGFARGQRVGRIADLITAGIRRGARFTQEGMERMQADTVLPEARYFVPFLSAALERAGKAGAAPELRRWRDDAGVVEAVARLRRWDFTTPTGIREGFDAADTEGQRLEPRPTEIAHSVAATLYTLWFGRLARNTLDVPLDPASLPRSPLAATSLKHLLDHFPGNRGRGASGLDFFRVPGVKSPEDRRDILMLKSMRDALDLLAGDRFADAFGRSTDQQSYRWGRLHRVLCEHPLGDPFSVPTAGGAFPSPLRDLPGIPVDGGNEALDVGGQDPRADQTADFLHAFGASVRLVSSAAWPRVRARFALPGGTSGVLGSPHYVDLLPHYLTNESLPLLVTDPEIVRAAESVIRFAP